MHLVPERPSHHVRPRLTRWATLVLASLVFVSLSAASAHASPCVAKTIGMDSTQADTYTGPTLGEAIAQVFTTSDTLIQSITVWRLIVQTPNFNGMKVYITELDSTGMPDAQRIILDGPIVFVPYGDGVHPIPIDFVFDPPFALPHRGSFCFALQTNPHCYGSWEIYSNKSNPYREGCMWIFARSECYLVLYPTSYPTVDLTFRIRFCDTATPVTSHTWGDLKIIYRR